MEWIRRSSWLACVAVGCGSPSDDPAGAGSETGSADDDAASASDPDATGGHASTGGTDSTGDPPAPGGTIHGAVEKGPFILGSELELALLDASAMPTGQTFPASVVDDLGTFEIAIPGDLAWASASGFHFDEVSGVLSTAQLTLHALVVVDAPEVERHVNVLTDLSAERARALVETGTAPDEAIAQASAELVAALPLGVGHVPTTAFESLAIFGDGGADAAYLLAVSATVLQAAHDAHGGDDPYDDEPPPDATAQLQAGLNSLALDLADDGALSGGAVDDLRTASHHVDADAVLAHLQARGQSVGAPFLAPPLASMLDQDDDGVSDADDNCIGVANPDQTDGDADDEGDACENCIDPTLPDYDNDGTREPCDNCEFPNESQLDGDGDGIGNPCDSCPMTAEGEAGACCDPRDAETWCREPDGNIQNTMCDDGASGFQCRGIDLGSSQYGENCLGGCGGYGATCVPAGGFPPWANPLNGFQCADGDSCCSKYCTVGNDAACAHASLTSVPTCVPYFAEGDAPPGLETLGICADTTDGPCAEDGAYGRACAKNLE